MAYPSKNTSTYTAPSKNSSSSTLPALSGQNFLMIDDTFFFLIDTTFKLLLESNSQDWSYQSKS